MKVGQGDVLQAAATIAAAKIVHGTHESTRDNLLASIKEVILALEHFEWTAGDALLTTWEALPP